MQVTKNKLQFTYEFISIGSKVLVNNEQNKFYVDIDGERITYDRSQTVILDVGNCLANGIIDVHHMENGFAWKDEKIVSTTKLLTYFPSYLNNLAENVEQVTIVVHANPDFDCLAAAYLVSYYLENGEFPYHATELAQYAENIDAGRVSLNVNQVFTPYSVTHVLSQSVGKKRYDSFIEYQREYMARGLQLIDYILSRLPLLRESERSIESPVLFTDDHPFQLEQALIEADFQKYQRDLHTICEKRKMRLPCLNGATKEVDGLFWNEPSTCSMDRLWARSDTSSPSGTGYVFTFVPKAPRKISKEIGAKFQELSLQKHEVIKNTNQVIISVDGNSDVSLVDLGKMLELEEQKREEAIFGKTKRGDWRSRNPEIRRFPEEWFDNCDPWYDGRNNQYQIVDAPKIGSLMTIQQIKEITINYTKPKVKSYCSKILFPFHFQTKEFHKLCKTLTKNTSFHKQDQMNEKSLVDYFRPYIRDYLFQSGKNEKGYSYSFENDSKYKLRLKAANGKVFSAENISNAMEEPLNDFIVEIESTSISLFRYGIGFIIVQTSIVQHNIEEDLLLDLYLETNRELCEGMSGKGILTKTTQFLGEAASFIEEYEDGLMYADVTLSASTHFEAAKKELLYKLCSQTEWSTTFHSDNKYMMNTLDRMYYDINEQTVMGFSKKGSILLIFEKDTNKLSEEQCKEYRREIESERLKFQTWDYYIFLLVLHQRYGLMNFSKELAAIGVKNKQRKVAKLREILYEFIIQGWFSQITNDEHGMNIYKKWLDIFETQALHDEVLEQVSTIADYQGAKKDGEFAIKFNIISFFFLIITGVTGFFGMNIPWISEYSNKEAIWFSIYSCIGVIAFWLIISGGYWIVKKIRES